MIEGQNVLNVEKKFCHADKENVVVMEIPAAVNTPTSFRGTEFIRVGLYKKKLKEYPEKERNCIGMVI